VGLDVPDRQLSAPTAAIFKDGRHFQVLSEDGHGLICVWNVILLYLSNCVQLSEKVIAVIYFQDCGSHHLGFCGKKILKANLFLRRRF